jgi:hypothetical protein
LGVSARAARGTAGFERCFPLVHRNAGFCLPLVKFPEFRMPAAIQTRSA